MEEYFSTTLNKLKSNNYSNLTIVLGNESCDLDSAVTSIVYAIFLHWQHNRIKCKVCTASKRSEECSDDIFISVLDVNREDFGLKTEVVFCLEEHGITDKDLVFSDDINMEKLVAEGKTKIVLVDHHVLAKKYDYLAPYVTEIIDHRPLDRSQWTYSEDTRNTIEVVGSCCTLIAQRIRDLSALIAKEVDFFSDHPACTQLLYSVILLDTVNFSKDVNKATKHDEEIVAFLEHLLKVDQCETERKLRVDRLLAARSDVSSLSAAQLLRKDLKIFGHILVPSFPILVKDFLQKPNALEAVSEALSSRGCALALLLGMELKVTLQRDATVISSVEHELAEDLAKFLQKWSSPSLQLISVPEVHCFYFKQMNLSASRKQYVPTLNEFLNICK
ncbi:exopolyphosphatase PRUNE1-like [Maniola jurtina]|uniref:exopolyphosphatase PRUNE1-like n=1 Tax=Maniola jurtina TaxID=191418 RepID=UPI001E686821|nr:exopolyphosphatase PRUNE1-like [Maniola jurtina]